MLTHHPAFFNTKLFLEHLVRQSSDGGKQGTLTMLATSQHRRGKRERAVETDHRNTGGFFLFLFQHFNETLLHCSTALPRDVLRKQNTVQPVHFAASFPHWPLVVLKQVFMPSFLFKRHPECHLTHTQGALRDNVSHVMGSSFNYLNSNYEELCIVYHSGMAVEKEPVRGLNWTGRKFKTFYCYT